MLEDIITGEDNPEHLASLALGRLRVTIPITTCSRRKDPFPSSLSASGVYWIKYSLWNTKLLCSKNAWRTSAETSRSCRKRWRWDTIPGVDRVALLAEVGDKVAKFPTAEQLASWDALSPGNHESAGKCLRGATPQGSPWLRRMACQCAWAAARTKNTYLSSQFRRLARGAARREPSSLWHIPHSHWLSLAEEPKQLRRSWRKLLRSHPLRWSQAVFGEAAPATRAQGNPRTDGSGLTQRFPRRGFRGRRWLATFTALLCRGGDSWSRRRGFSFASPH
jgi:hypothetical protein